MAAAIAVKEPILLRYVFRDVGGIYRGADGDDVRKCIAAEQVEDQLCRWRLKRSDGLLNEKGVYRPGARSILLILESAHSRGTRQLLVRARNQLIHRIVPQLIGIVQILPSAGQPEETRVQHRRGLMLTHAFLQRSHKTAATDSLGASLRSTSRAAPLPASVLTLPPSNRTRISRRFDLVKTNSRPFDFPIELVVVFTFSTD